MNADAARILGNDDLTPYQKWEALAVIENEARRARDGVVPFHPGGDHPNKGKICESTRAVLMALDGEMDTAQVAKLAGTENKKASGALQRLLAFGLVRKIGVRHFLTPTGKRKLNVWQITEAGEECRNA